MGLLTDPSAGQSKAIKLLIKYYHKLCVLLYIAGVVYFCALASSQFTADTYFSENALLPGLVKSEFRDENAAKEYYAELMDEMQKYDDSIPYPWLLAKFKQLGLDTYTHNFTLNYPLGYPQTYSGKNVYGIVRAPRAASTEALVVSVPYRPPVSVHPPTAASIAIMLAFAKFAVKEKYWAKDIIFLITEHEQLGMQAWLEAYHGVKCGRRNVLLAGDMRGRAGAIQAAINLELHAPEIGKVDLKIEGLNGQLPNLDLFNLAARMVMKEGLVLTFKNRQSKKIKEVWKDWKYSLETMMHMMATQASGVPNGNHGLYYRFGIQALTIEGFAPSNSRVHKVGFYTMGRILEGTFRSLNNLLERFHQSFFFYLLPSHDRYISIGLYMPAIALLTATLFIKCYAKCCQLSKKKEVETSEFPGSGYSAEEVKQHRTKMAKLGMRDWKKKFEAECDREYPDVGNVSLGHICLVFVLNHILGFSLRDLPKYITKLGIQYGYSTDVSIYYGLAAVSLLAMMFPLLVKRPNYKSLAYLNTLCLLELGTALACISMYNISLAMVLAVIYAPAALLINPSRCGACNKLQKVMWFLVHPLVLLTEIVLIYTFITFPGEAPKELLFRALGATQNALTFSIVDSMIYGNWLYSAIVGIFFSNWLSLWYVLFSEPPGEEGDVDSSLKVKQE